MQVESVTKIPLPFEGGEGLRDQENVAQQPNWRRRGVCLSRAVNRWLDEPRRPLRLNQAGTLQSFYFMFKAFRDKQPND
jgi:hypothetical protein